MDSYECVFKVDDVQFQTFVGFESRALALWYGREVEQAPIPTRLLYIIRTQRRDRRSASAS